MRQFYIILTIINILCLIQNVINKRLDVMIFNIIAIICCMAAALK